MSEPFVAEVRIFACNFAPRGWAFCNGQLLPIAQNTALFSLVGTTYGGDGRTTLGLPNLQGRAAMHPGNGPGLSSRSLGETGGRNTETLSMPKMPQHNHLMKGNSEPATSGDPSGAQLADASPLKNYGSSRDNETLASQAISSAGGGGAHNNQQPYQAMNFVIALIGVYPSRS
jgi:microcystin-dependent protein